MSAQEICGHDARDDDRVPWDTCRNPAGWGTDNIGEGACTLHKDDQTKAEMSSIFAPNHGYYSRLTRDSQEKLDMLAHDFVERFRSNKGVVDEIDREFARSLAVDMHIARESSRYIGKHGLTEEVDDGKEKVNKLMYQHKQLKESIVNRMKKLGILRDPDTKKAEAMSKQKEWRSFLEQEA